MKQENIKYYVISVFVVISLICVGFATWTQIKMFDEDFANGAINADPVVKTDEYLSFNTEKGKNETGIEIFQYAENGIVYQDEDGVLRFSNSQAPITLHYNLHYADGLYDVFTTDVILVDVEMTVTSSGFYDKIDDHDTASITADGVLIAAPSEGKAGNNRIRISFQIQKPTAATEFSIQIMLAGNFSDGLDVALSNNEFLFNTSLKEATTNG